MKVCFFLVLLSVSGTSQSDGAISCDSNGGSGSVRNGWFLEKAQVHDRGDVLEFRHPARRNAGKDPFLVEVDRQLAPRSCLIELHRHLPTFTLDKAGQTGRRLGVLRSDVTELDSQPHG